VLPASHAAGLPQPPLPAPRREISAAVFGPGAPPLAICVDAASIVIYEARCLERLVSLHTVPFCGGADSRPPAAEEAVRVKLIVAEADAPGYYELVAKAGNRAGHYAAPTIGATLAHFLRSGAADQGGSPRGAGRHETRAGLRQRGVQELQDRRRLAAAVGALRAAVDAALPGAYRWFDEASLHVTLRALIL
jgi:hypothetical protein